MKPQSIIVVDNFYDDPDFVRNHALSLEYVEREKASYPGVESVSLRDWEPTRRELMRYINEDVSFPCHKSEEFSQGKFRLAMSKDSEKRSDLVHVDQQKYSGIVYLSKNIHCQGGVAFYKHKATGETALTEHLLSHPDFSFIHDGLPEKQLKQRFITYFNQPDHWHKVGEIEMKYNRAVIIMARVFHGSTGIFGDEPANCRLTQHFEFYSRN